MLLGHSPKICINTHTHTHTNTHTHTHTHTQTYTDISCAYQIMCPEEISEYYGICKVTADQRQAACSKDSIPARDPSKPMHQCTVHTQQCLDHTQVHCHLAMTFQRPLRQQTCINNRPNLQRKTVLKLHIVQVIHDLRMAWCCRSLLIFLSFSSCCRALWPARNTMQHTCTHARTHAHTHARTYTHISTCIKFECVLGGFFLLFSKGT